MSKTDRRAIVIQATRSPMNPNPKQWLIRLDCGHEVWATLSHQPAIGGHKTCEECATSQVTDR